jgi:hypothetical protein
MMLRITAEQMSVFTARAENQFVHRVGAFLKGHFPDAEELSDGDLASEVSVQTTKAQAYGLISEREIVSYVLAAKFLGSDFDQHPEVQGVLSRADTSVTKAQFLDAMIVFHAASRQED